MEIHNQKGSFPRNWKAVVIVKHTFSFLFFFFFINLKKKKRVDDVARDGLPVRKRSKEG